MPDDVSSRAIPRPVRRSADTATRLAGLIRARLQGGDIKPGARINEVALARVFGVSRTPLREALHRLTSERLLDFEPNRGFSSRPLRVPELVDLYETRIVIEVAAVRLACARAPAPGLANLAEFWAGFQSEFRTRSGAELAGVDVDFHERLAALGQSAELLALLRGLNMRTWHVRCLGLDQGAMRQRHMADAHGAVLRAVHAGDTEVAVDLLTLHIRKREAEIASLIGDTTPSPPALGRHGC